MGRRRDLIELDGLLTRTRSNSKTGLMFQETRQAAILREIEIRGEIKVTEYARRTGLSPMTIRRDLASLREKGLVDRIHGGAISPGTAALQPDVGNKRKISIATIGMIVPASTYYFPAIIRGAEAAASERGVRLILGVSDYSQEEECRQIQRMLSNDFDGLIVTPSDSFEPGSLTYKMLGEVDIPVVIMERLLDGASAQTPFQAVRTDHAHGAEISVRHLLALGHRRLALATRPSPTEPLVHQGFERALRAAATGTARYVHGRIAPTGDGLAAVRGSLEHFLKRCVDERVTAALVLPDEAAVTLMELTQDSSLELPEGFTIVAYDDEIASLAPVPLTAVAPPKWQVGYTALKMCFDDISSSTAVPRPARVRAALLPELIVRESSLLQNG